VAGTVIATTDFDTPVLAIDLERVSNNIASLQGYCDEHSFKLRPHIKTHKLPAVAHMQMQAGASGIACQKLGEAEVMVQSGLTDILITFPLIGAAKAERLAALARLANVSVACDSTAGADGLSAVLAQAGVEVGCLVDCDTGYGRTGVQSPEEAAALAVHVASLPGLRFGGLFTYPTVKASGEWLAAARSLIEKDGLRVETISGGGTLGARQTHEIGVVTEIRAGTYVYGDRMCVANGSMSVSDCALHVLATVVSRPTRDRAIIDAGSKALSSDLVDSVPGFGQVLEYPKATIYQLNEEHGYVDLGSGGDPAVGEVVTILPNHVCVAVNLFETAIVHRSGHIVGEWPVAARGKLR
jgi:D-serine deaminase-like pyridoxal phosphate-dependent protein